MSIVMKSFFKAEEDTGNVPSPDTSKSQSLSTVFHSSENDRSSCSNTLPVLGNAVLDAEIRWAIKCVTAHYSFNSCKNINTLFQDMFPDSHIASQFSCAPTKCAYLICFGISPYYENLLYERLKNCLSYCLLFDESLNKHLQSKQLDIHVRFWNQSENLVEISYLTSLFMGHATAESIFSVFTETLKKLSFDKVIQLSMDGPAVNLKLHNMFQQQMKSEFNKEILDIGSCGLHVLNNAFKHGCREAGWDLDSFLSSLYYLLKDSPARREDFLLVSQTKKMPLKFCKHRWLENLPAAERALEILPDIKIYVDNVEKGILPKPKSKSYSNIQQTCKDILICVKLNFFISVSKIITPFQAFYQSSKPLLPFIAEDLLKIISSLILTFSTFKKEKSSILNSVFKVSKLDLKDESNHSCCSKVSVGFVGDLLVKNLLFVKEVSEREIFELKCKAQKCIFATVSHLLEKSPIKYSFVRCLSSIDPRHMALNSNDCYIKMKKILVQLSKTGFVPTGDCEDILMEFTNFFANIVANSSEDFKNFDPHDKNTRLDCFLNKYFNQKQYLKVWNTIKLLLILSHGQADVERGFSFNRQLEIENLKQKSLIAQRIITDYFIKNGNNIEINKELRLSAACARQKYLAYLSEQKRLREVETKVLKRKPIMEDLTEMRNKKARLESAIKDLENGADKLADKA